MCTIQQEFLVDEKGNKKAVVIPLSEWQRILEDIEELDDIRAYDDVKSRPSEPIPFEDAVEQIQEEI